MEVSIQECEWLAAPVEWKDKATTRQGLLGSGRGRASLSAQRTEEGPVGVARAGGRAGQMEGKSVTATTRQRWGGPWWRGEEEEGGEERREE